MRVGDDSGLDAPALDDLRGRAGSQGDDLVGAAHQDFQLFEVERVVREVGVVQVVGGEHQRFVVMVE